MPIADPQTDSDLVAKKLAESLGTNGRNAEAVNSQVQTTLSPVRNLYLSLKSELESNPILGVYALRLNQLPGKWVNKEGTALLGRDIC